MSHQVVESVGGEWEDEQDRRTQETIDRLGAEGLEVVLEHNARVEAAFVSSGRIFTSRPVRS